MMSCRQCKYFKRVDVDTDQWTCGDSVSWCNPNTGEEVCRYWQGAIQREPQPQDIVEAETQHTTGKGGHGMVESHRAPAGSCGLTGHHAATHPLPKRWCKLLAF